MSLPINPIAAILVANGQGETAVSNPKRKAVSAGAVLLSNNVCNHSIELYFNKVRTFSATPFLKVAGAVLALAKAYSVRFSYVSLPAFHLLMKSEDHVTSYFSAIASFFGSEMSIVLKTSVPFFSSSANSASTASLAFFSIAMQVAHRCLL